VDFRLVGDLGFALLHPNSLRARITALSRCRERSVVTGMMLNIVDVVGRDVVEEALIDG
jgi:hypothetical protein